MIANEASTSSGFAEAYTLLETKTLLPCYTVNVTTNLSLIPST